MTEPTRIQLPPWRRGSECREKGWYARRLDGEDEESLDLIRFGADNDTMTRRVAVLVATLLWPLTLTIAIVVSLVVVIAAPLWCRAAERKP